MSEQNPPENPIFQVTQTLYEQLLEGQKQLETNHPEDYTDSDLDQPQSQSQKKTNQNDTKP